MAGARRAVVPDAEALRAAGRGAGLDVVEVASAEPFVDVRRTLEQRKADGLHGGMSFTYRQPARSTDPEAALRDASALVVGARSYLMDDHVDAPRGPLAGRVARYAWDDHYAHLKTGLKAVAAVLKEHGWRARVLADDNAMVDRAAAHRAGIGWWGKSANLLLPGLGSWYVLGCVVTDAPVPSTAAPVADQCGPCRRCLDGCPTGAIVAPGVVDARRCLSWLLQAEGSFPRQHRDDLGDRIYGCDECQEVCPPNRRAPQRAPSGQEAPWADLVPLLDPDDAVVLARAGRWYIPQRDVRYVRRNALVVLGNVGDPDDPTVVDLLSRHLAHEDPLLRGHAVWAARRLGREDLLPPVERETDATVLAERRAPLSAALR
jgi:epoxyqueuosine reductase